MTDVIAAVDSTTGAFGPLVQNRLYADMQNAINSGVTNTIAAMGDVTTQVASKVTEATIQAKLPIRWLAGAGIDPTGATASTAAVQAILTGAPAGTAVYVPSGAIIKLDATINITKRITLTGAGELRWVAGTANAAGIGISADQVVVDGVRMVNTVAPAQSGEKQTGISISANNVTITRTTTDGFQQGIVVQPFGEYYGTVIIGNHILNVPGSGDGPASGSSNGEDRGDGIVVWGASATIIGNRVTTANGNDCRIGIHCEGIPAYEGTPGGHSSSLVTIQGNVVTGQFRRSIATEGVAGCNISGNTVADATWWGIGVTGGNGSVCSNNTIIWTRDNGDNQGSAFSPNRTGIMVYGGGSNTVVAGNVIRVIPGALMPFGIHVQTNGVGTRDGLLIANNIVRDEQGSMYAGIYANGGGGQLNELRILNNTVSGYNNIGIYNWNAPDVEVNGNRLTGPTGNTADGIVCDGNGSGARADNNTIYYANTAIRITGRNQLTTAKANLLYSANFGINFTGTSSPGLEANTMVGVTTPVKS